ncbi:archaeosortase/exosortase family protein [Cognatitamlana onchidii]|uniref:archaeosortase/exosortase family protein n=1 Tax=Cognatitamlana onchidii TaxID=2562860 RepID=UPI0010A5E2F4|nr:archaeosortase/exosortase family protein [Algibacter onchidii]
MIFIIWEIVYGLFLYDSQIIDRLLTTHVGESSVMILNNLGDFSGFTSRTESWSSVYSGETLENQVSAIYHNNKRVLYIANACNGLSLLVLYIGFIVCMPSSFWRKLKYIVLGLLVLDSINIMRCVGLILLQEYYETYFDFAHHYLFKATVYASTFFIWMIYSRKINLKNEVI